MRPSAASLALLLLAALPAAGAVVPAGTAVEIRLTSKLASNASKVKDPVEAMVIRPVMGNGEVLIPAKSTLTGRLTEVKAAGESEQARIGFVLNKLALPGAGKPLKVSMVLKSVDNARETVDDKGTIVGIIGSDTISSRMDQGIARVAERYKGLGDLLGTTKSAIVKQSDAEIVYGPGVEMSMALTSGLTVTAPSTVAAVAPGPWNTSSIVPLG